MEDKEDDLTTLAARRALLGDLDLLREMLGAAAPVAANSCAEIPVLLDVVDIPGLEVEPRVDKGGDRCDQHTCVDSAGIPQEEIRSVLEIEAKRLIEEILDEFLPEIEARLRDRLETRRNELVRSNMRELRRPG